MEKSEINGEVAVTVPTRQGKLLIMKRSEETSSSGLWAFPGGKIRRDEEASEAALRELEEETGLNGEIVEEGESCIDGGELGEWRLHTFLVEVEDDSVELNHEHSEFRWVSKEKLSELDTLGDLKVVEKLDLP